MRDFVSIGRYLALADGNVKMAGRMAEQDGASARVIGAFATRAAVPAGSTDGDSWGGALVPLALAFDVTVGWFGLFDGAFMDMRQVPLRQRLALVTGAAKGREVIEGRPKALSSLTTSHDALPGRKAAAIVALTRELLDASSTSSVNLLPELLLRAIVAATDEIFVDDLLGEIGSGAIPATGVDAAGVLADIGALLGGLSLGADSKVHFAISAEIAKRLATMATTSGAQAFPTITLDGGMLLGRPVHVTGALDDETVLAIDAAGFVAATEPTQINGTSQAALEMEEEPTQDATSGTGTALVSLWQTGSAAVLAERRFDFAPARSGAFAALSGVAWGDEQSGV